MATVPHRAIPQDQRLLRGTLIFLAALVTARFVSEIAGASHTVTQFLSSLAGLLLAGIYVGAVAPLRGVTRFAKLIVPAIILSAWTVGWVILFTLLSGALRLERSHFSEREDYGNWGHLGHHILDHVVEAAILAVIVLVLMAVPFVLRRWPITVAPAAILGGLVIMRYTTESLGVADWRAAAWSSTVGVLVCGFYLGGAGHWFGFNSGRQLLLPALLIGWAWRFWAWLAAVLSAAFPFYKTHFFDPSQGYVAARLARLLGLSAIEGFVVGLIVVWGIAIWIFHATSAGSAPE